MRSSNDPSYAVHSPPILVVPCAALGVDDADDDSRNVALGMRCTLCGSTTCSLLRYWLLRNIPLSPTITCGCRCNDGFESESSLINVQMFVDARLRFSVRDPALLDVDDVFFGGLSASYTREVSLVYTFLRL